MIQMLKNQNSGKTSEANYIGQTVQILSYRLLLPEKTDCPSVQKIAYTGTQHTV
jgi:hypothetical protein